jgi:hypothetical protein
VSAYGEQEVRRALEYLGIRFETDVPVGGRVLDFYLPYIDVYVEVKSFHSERAAQQLAAAPNVILLQGRPAIDAFVALLRRASGLRPASARPTW